MPLNKADKWVANRSFFGGTVWFDWTWFLSLWKEADNGCSACMWFGVDGVSVLYAECNCAGFDRFGVGCNSIFLSSLSDGVKFMV